MARRSSAATASKKKAGKINVDFTGVETRVLLPEGVYNATVAEVKQEEGDKAPYLAWKFLTVDDDEKLNNKPLYNNTSLAPQSLWVLASLLDTLGVERPDGAMDIDLEELVGLEIGLIVEHEEYQGKMRAKVVDFTPANGDEGDEGEVVDDEGEDGETVTEDEILAMDADELDTFVEENDLKVKKSKKLAAYAAAVVAAAEKAGLIGEEADEEDDEEAEDDGEAVTEDDINGMDADALAEFCEENELEVKASKKIAAYRKAVIEAATKAGLLGGDDEEEEDDDLYSADDINAMDQDELDEVNTENKLKVKMGKILKKNRQLVIDALEAKELLADE